MHGAFRPGAGTLYALYDLCAERGVPVIVHTGGSIFPGSEPEAGDPALMRQVIADFPTVTFVLAHGGRGRCVRPTPPGWRSPKPDVST